MEDKPIVNIAATQCPPEVEEKFNTWYNEIHVPMLLKFKGIREAARYKIINGTEGSPKYLSVFEFESLKAFEEYGTSPELTLARADFRETWKGGEVEIKWQAQYEVIRTWKR